MRKKPLVLESFPPLLKKWEKVIGHSCWDISSPADNEQMALMTTTMMMTTPTGQNKVLLGKCIEKRWALWWRIRVGGHPRRKLENPRVVKLDQHQTNQKAFLFNCHTHLNRNHPRRTGNLFDQNVSIKSRVRSLCVWVLLCICGKMIRFFRCKEVACLFCEWMLIA